MAKPSRPRRPALRKTSGGGGTESPPRRRLKTQTRRRIKTQGSARGPNPIDIHVGARVRLRRNLLGLTLQTLAKAIGVTYQQLQKYEWGVNRVGASRLFTLGLALEVPVAFFFDEMPAAAKRTPGRWSRGLSEAPAAALGPDPLGKRETTDLVRAYWQIADAGTRKRFLDLLKAITPG